MMRFLVAAVRVYMLVIIVRALFTWLPAHARDNEVYRFLMQVTEPVLKPVRRALPTTGGVDLSPLIVLLALALLAHVLAGF
ncbi:MAG: YggT family protein [Candidatus Brocadiaceae bacterium]|jgi:YggT family protein